MAKTKPKTRSNITNHNHPEGDNCPQCRVRFRWHKSEEGLCYWCTQGVDEKRKLVVKAPTIRKGKK